MKLWDIPTVNVPPWKVLPISCGDINLHHEEEVGPAGTCRRLLGLCPHKWINSTGLINASMCW